ncbi:MAG: hypothetical protein AAF607_06330 [Pseudomonadota bacterium]
MTEHTPWFVELQDEQPGASYNVVCTYYDDKTQEAAAQYCTKEDAELFAKVLNNRAEHEAVDEMAEVLEELADDLSGYVESEYKNLRGYNRYEIKRAGDMEPVNKARALLERVKR